MTLKNEIQRYTKQDALYEEATITGRKKQRPIYLIVKLGDDGFVRVETKIPDDYSTIEYFCTCNGTQKEYNLPDLVRADTLRNEIEIKILPILEEINANTEIDWNGHGETIDEKLAGDLYARIYLALLGLPQYKVKDL